MHKINLLWLSTHEDLPEWKYGEVLRAELDPKIIPAVLSKHLVSTNSDAWLFWDPGLGRPDSSRIISLLDSSPDVWHAGLKLGLSAQPEFIDFVNPTWMLNRDPDPGIEATSWRLSLRACLIRTEALRQLGGPRADFDSVDAAGLELGYRYIHNGAVIRHCPQLLASGEAEKSALIGINDQMKFIAACYGQKWVYWAGMRAVLSGRARFTEAVHGIKSARGVTPRVALQPLQRHAAPVKLPSTPAAVSVLIPTVNRYPYLRTLLSQLRRQTIQPLEIIIVDQTPPAARDEQLQADFADLPIKWSWLEQAGQSSARNLGLAQAGGEYVLFLDDDVEVPPDFIYRHLVSIQQNQSTVLNGTVYEPGDPERRGGLFLPKISDVFAGGNALLRREFLNKSGLFDLAYDRGQRADHDLGMRIYLNSGLMITDPGISILHHHAPQGGLREHKARVVTRAASRRSVRLRVITSVSDIYLAKRYFTTAQVKEMLWINVFSMFTMEGSIFRKLIRIALNLITLPVTILKLNANEKRAETMLKEYPQIPLLHDAYE